MAHSWDYHLQISARKGMCACRSSSWDGAPVVDGNCRSIITDLPAGARSISEEGRLAMRREDSWPEWKIAMRDAIEEKAEETGRWPRGAWLGKLHKLTRPPKRSESETPE